MSKRKRFKRKFNKFLDFELPMLVGCLLTLFLVSCYNRVEASELRLDIDDVLLEDSMIICFTNINKVHYARKQHTKL